MSRESIAHPPPRPLVERKKRSCGECRRRKQKCDQRQPCRNCSRRMPQPICQYENCRVELSPSLIEAALDLSTSSNSSPTIPASTSYSPASYLEPSYLVQWAHTVPSYFEPWESSGVLQQGPHSYGVSSVAGKREVNLYLDNFLPLPRQDQILPRIPSFIETCGLIPRTVVDQDSVFPARCSAIEDVHQLLTSSESATSDEAVATVVKLVISDLCYGETQNLRVHVDGSREITRLRGGLSKLGMDGTLAKMVIIGDITTAVALEMPLPHLEGELSDFTKFLNNTMPASTPTSFARGNDSPSPKRMDPSISAMLKDVEFLLDTVLALPQDPSAWQLQKVQSMSKWVHGRLSGAEQTSTKHLHKAVRLSCLMYCRAIQARRPLTQMVNEKDVVELVDTVWKVPLEEWNGLLGTLLTVLVVVLPTARSTPRYFSTRMMMMAAAVHLAVVDWDSVAGVLGRVVKLQAWLRGAVQG